MVEYIRRDDALNFELEAELDPETVPYIIKGLRLYMDYLKSLSAVSVTTGGWISVEERLPEEADGTVLVCMPNKFPYNEREHFINAKHNQQVETATYSQHSDTWYFAMGAVSETRPIAWMPLPEPPKKEDNLLG